MEETLFTFAGTAITGRGFTEALLVLIISLGVALLARLGLLHLFKLRGLTNKDDIKDYTHAGLLLVWIPGIVTALHVAGFKVTALFAAGGVFAVILGLAVKGIMESYVSGITLKLEHSIRRGDIVLVNGIAGVVKRISTRSTQIQGFEGSLHIIPNRQLIQSTVQNKTLDAAALHRVTTEVGVSYASDVPKVKKALEQAAAGVDGRSTQKDPAILMTEFGESALQFEIEIWIEDPTTSRRTQGRLNESIWHALQEAGIEIACPRLDVHLAGEAGTPGAS